MTRILIVDDEQKSREVLKTLLNMFCDPDLEVTESGILTEALSLIQTTRPELVFLDISLREGDSFELLSQLKEISFEPIFITAYEENAIRALTYCKVLSLMKPIEIESLQFVFAEAMKRKGKGIGAHHYALASHLLPTTPAFLPVWTSNGAQLIPVAQIEEIKPNQDKCAIILQDGKRIEIENSCRDIQALSPVFNARVK
jgi:two-component system LytT family response regulator